MKLSDIDELQQTGLISPEQREAIVRHFKLDRETNKLLLILGIIGAVMLCAGIVLVVSANWDGIPKFLKLALGVALLVGAHFGGWHCGRSGRHPAFAAILHLIGAGLFLANIALVGQVYNLSSRMPNAVLLWLVGIVPLPWILRSRAMHILTLIVFGTWLGLELDESSSRFYFGADERLPVLYAMLAVMFIGLGGMLRRGRFAEFAGSTEKFGLLGLHLASLPLMFSFFYRSEEVSRAGWGLCSAVTLFAVLLLVVGMRHTEEGIDRGWRWIWLGCLAGVLGLAWVGLGWKGDYDYFGGQKMPGPHWVATPAMFIVSLLQIQVGVRRRIPFFINLAIVFVAIQLLTSYFQLFGSLMDTGVIFLGTGVLLLALGWVLERKRRVLIRALTSNIPTNPQP